MEAQLTLTGRSRKKYHYEIFEWPADTLLAKAGNYAFLAQTTQNNFEVLYCGETEDLSERFGNHHKSHCALRNRVTHVCAKITTGGKDVRLSEERDLIAAYDPICNG